MKFKEGVPEDKKRGLHKKHGAEKLKEFPELRLHHVKLRKGMTVEEGVKACRSDPDVEYAEPNFIYTAQGAPFAGFYYKQPNSMSGQKTP